MDTAYQIWFGQRHIGTVGLHNEKPFYRTEIEGVKTPKQIIQDIAQAAGVSVEQTLADLEAFIPNSGYLRVVKTV